MSPPAENEVKIYKARKRVLLDLVLIFSIGFIILAVLLSLSMIVTVAVILMVTALLTAIWVWLVRPLARIEMTANTITGRSPDLSKVTISFRKVDFHKTYTPLRGWKKLVYKDLWSVDETRIRMYRRVIGEDQLRKIMATIEKYPFRENPKAPTAQS